MVTILYLVQAPQGMDLAYLQTGISGAFFRFWISRISTFLGLLNKSCILKCFILSKVFLGPVLFTRCFNNHGSPLLSHDAGVSRNEQCFWGYFLGFCFSESIFLGFLLVVKYFLGPSEIPSSTYSCLLVCQVHHLGQALTRCLTDRISVTNFYHYEFVIQDPTTESFLVLMICFFYGNTWLM